ncbi:hypothetical protein C8J57DRAFT_1252985 [Mycena rebaudengoi]|nr:hypothetical protein C8J57DRAFT_1252985 [Mycena rebaudengoi]
MLFKYVVLPLIVSLAGSAVAAPHRMDASMMRRKAVPQALQVQAAAAAAAQATVTETVTETATETATETVTETATETVTETAALMRGKHKVPQHVPHPMAAATYGKYVALPQK